MGNKNEETNNEPLVFIGIPVYNGEKYIIEALNSVKNLCYHNYECHIINNRSTDKTQIIVEEYLKETNDTRFILHNYQEFVDLTSNWNRIILHIPETAKYFKVLQADDILFPGAINKMVDLMEKYPNAGIGSAIRMIGKHFDGYGIDYFKGNFHPGKEILLNHLLGTTEVTGSVTQLFFRIRDLKRVPTFPQVFDPDEYHIDTRLAYEMFFISDLIYIFEPLSYSRRHETSETITKVNKFNTLLHGKESRLFRFKPFFPEIEPLYCYIRRKYAYFMIKNILTNKNETVNWHKKFLRRSFTPREYVMSIILKNKMIQNQTCESSKKHASQ